MTPSPASHLDPVLDDILIGRRSVSFRNEGFSMHPFIKKNDAITISPVIYRPDPEDEEIPRAVLRIGDVVLYKNASDRWLLHRIIKKRGGSEDEIVTKGDSLLISDPPVARSRIRGKLIFLARAETNREYRLEKAFQRIICSLIALFSRMEASVFSIFLDIEPRFSDREYMLMVRKGIKFPKWLLIRIVFP